MATGNSYGLGEISHFGSFQRVGGKAGGFINKKFFHPSSLRNQEKLWMAMSADERERKKDDEMNKRRDEERQVEELRKQMYLSGQGKASDIALAAAAQAEQNTKLLSMSEKTEQKEAIDEQKRRKAMLRKERERSARDANQALAGSPEADGEDGSGDEDEDTAAKGSDERIMARSRYEEDVRIRGHRSVWGSWYSEQEKKWGFACCKIRDFLVERCPLEPAPEEKVEKAPRGKKRRRRGGAQADGAASDDAPEGSPEEAEEEPAAPQGGLQGRAAGSSSSAPDAPLMDERMLQAAERREKQRKLDERKKDEAKTSGYLADLLADPTA